MDHHPNLTESFVLYWKNSFGFKRLHAVNLFLVCLLLFVWFDVLRPTQHLWSVNLTHFFFLTGLTKQLILFRA